MEGQKWPAGQELQDVAFAAEKVPGAQRRGAAAALAHW